MNSLGKNKLLGLRGIVRSPLIAILSATLFIWIAFFTDLYIVSKFGLIFGVVVILVFLNNIGRTLPIKELIAFMMLLQMVIAPIIVYKFFGEASRFPLTLEEDVYMAYVMPGVILFLLALFVPLGFKSVNPIQVIKRMGVKRGANGDIGIVLIIIGFIALSVKQYVPNALFFLLYLLGSLRMIGLFYILFSDSKYKYIWIAMVFGSFLIFSIEGGVFHNLFIWGMFLSIFLAFRFKFNLVQKVLLFGMAITVAYFVNTIKEEYRVALWEEQVEDKTGAFIGIANNKLKQSGGIIDYTNFNQFSARLNQGWILCRVMNHVPENEPFTKGESLKEDMWAAIVPRILDPTKAKSGGKAHQEKFYRFTGKELIEGTTMKIGIFGDAWVNFGFYGGMVFMFGFGLFVNLVISQFYRLAKTYPMIILWIPFVFFYTMRVESDMLTILNFMSKSMLVLGLAIFSFKKAFT